MSGFAPARSRAFGPVLLLAVLGAGAAHAGPPGFAFLEIPTGARASALGGAYASLVSGVESVWWNPAGLDETQGVQITASHYELIQNLRYDSFALAGHPRGGGLVGSIRALYSEPIEERDELGNLIGSFGAHDLELALGYGWRLSNEVRLGATGQVYRERIANLSSTTFGFGVGSSWEPARWKGLRLGLAGQNLGPSAHYSFDGAQGAPVPLPAAAQGGVSYAHAAGKSATVTAALEARLTRGRSGIGMLGLELAHASGATLRAGFRANDSASTYALGAGYTRAGLRIDYAFVPFQLDLGDTQRFTLTARF